MCNENYTSPFVSHLPTRCSCFDNSAFHFQRGPQRNANCCPQFSICLIYIQFLALANYLISVSFTFLTLSLTEGPEITSYWVNSSMDTQKQGPGVKVKCKPESQLFSTVSLVHHRTQRMLSFFLAASHLSWVPIPHRGTVVRPKRRHSHLARLLRSRDREERPLVCGFGAWRDLVLAQQSLCLTQWPVVVIGDAFFT